MNPLLNAFIEWLLSEPKRTSDWDWLGDLEARSAEEERDDTDVTF